jgi:hypothetical protein
MIRSILGFAWMAAALVGIPAAFSRLYLGASWLDIAKAFGVLAAICLVWGAVSADTWEKRLMWAAILGMIGAIPGVPLILWLMRLSGFR